MQKDQETLTNESSSALQPRRQPGHLPAEIFIEILLLTRPQISEAQVWWLERLSLVCRFWHVVVDSTPALWSQISIEDNIPRVRKALSKSGEHPIDVCGESLTPAADWWGGGDKPSFTMFIAEVQQHERRWRHVTLRLPPPRESTSIPTFTILPTLQTLELISWEFLILSDQLLGLLNRQHVPFLRELSIRQVRIARWDLISLPPTLSKLEIARIKQDYPFIVGWLSIIAACPNLAVFRLRAAATSPGDGVKSDETCIAPPVVELKVLRELCLHQVHPDLILDILKRVRLPEDCAISIRCALQSPNPSTSFLSPALSNQRNFQRAGKVLEVTVHLTEGWDNLLVIYQRWRIDLNLSGPWAVRNALDWFINRGEDSTTSSSHPGNLQAGLATSNRPPITLKLVRNCLGLRFTQLGAISDLWDINRIEMQSLSDEHQRAFLFYVSAPEDPNQPARTIADFLQTPEPESKQEVEGVRPFPGLSELVRRGWSEEDTGYRVLVEPITGRCSDDAAVGTSGRVTRSELPEPNIPWAKVL